MFKKIVPLIVLICFSTMILGCGYNKDVCLPDSTGKSICKTYSQYGLVNESEMKNDKVNYQVIWGNVVWGCLLVETIFVPVIIFGWYLYEPVGPKATDTDKGVIQ